MFSPNLMEVKGETNGTGEGEVPSAAGEGTEFPSWQT